MENIIVRTARRSHLLILALLVPVVMAGCSASMASLATERASIAYRSAAHEDLVSLPPLEKKIVVSVYGFRDQTGQYKPLPNATSFSTAVTQGATAMLIQALNESNIFVPVEREGLQNLLTERKIIRAAAVDSGNPEMEKSILPPLLSSAIVLDGGIVSYDTNVVTGGFGAKYFGLGGNVDYRVDQVTLYLRAIDVKTGMVLKSVSTSKTILSRGVDVSLFRYVRLARLLEVETGLTTNEPAQICVLEAMEKAVSSLIIEGILDKVWFLSKPEDINSPVIQNYIKERGKPAPQLDSHGNLISMNDRLGPGAAPRATGAGMTEVRR